MKQPVRLTLSLRGVHKPLPFGIFSYYRRGKLISLALLLPESYTSYLLRLEALCL